MRGRHRRELFLELAPDRHRIDAHVFAGKARQEELTAVLRLEDRTKAVRHLEPALVIDAGRRVASKHETPRPILHYSPQKSTGMVGEAPVEVNRKILVLSKLRQIFAF